VTDNLGLKDENAPATCKVMRLPARSGEEQATS
jgi:hypothetical protein